MFLCGVGRWLLTQISTPPGPVVVISVHYSISFKDFTEFLRVERHVYHYYFPLPMPGEDMPCAVWIALSMIFWSLDTDLVQNPALRGPI